MTKTTFIPMRTFAVLNAVPKERLGQVLTRVLDKMARNEVEVFSASEKSQLETILMLSGEQIDSIIDVTMTIYHDAAMFGHVDQNLLTSHGVDENVVHAIEKAWRKRGRSVAAQIAAFKMVCRPALQLRKTEWRLHLEMGSNKRSRQSKPLAILQLDLVGPSANENEKMDVEISHTELRSLFLQLNAIQAELDTSPL
ncbi:HCaRG [Plasmopara halstedii]|uniref:HCaRG n=1 Tax=Plasmopara halstedii TaxID=4781 RepID=A0A0P1B2F9_PLAHL|nr:HCaRG [Plasmopara halstedii]CEG48064.1 HCaRG [Plasmopara halstedii]|eukprot:XP_024584433.1 HCaRG [Plasmopara halstedii]